MIGYGADADELDRLAAEFANAAHVLDARRVTLNTHIHHAHWTGHEADRFRHSWDQRHARAIVAAATYLHVARATPARNAQEQRVVSAAAGGATRRDATSTGTGGQRTDARGGRCAA